MDKDTLVFLFHERVAICVVDGIPQADAEWTAYLDLKKMVGRTKEGRAVALPSEIVEIIRKANATVCAAKKN